MLRDSASPGHGPVRSRIIDQTSLATALRRVGRAAVAALHDELVLEAKPGLVSLQDSGSHDDMDAETFMRSLFALRRFFVRISEAGAQGASFATLEALGVQAEQCMMTATHGVNTHRGSVFTIGLLCASAGAVLSAGMALSPQRIRRALLDRWGHTLIVRAGRPRDSKGYRVARLHGLASAGDEAARGFPTLFDRVVPAAREARLTGSDDAAVRRMALFTAMAWLDDTNLVHRGGIDALRFAKASARDYLQRSSATPSDALQHALSMHQAFVARRLSPGGSADLLAACCWIERVCDTASPGDLAPNAST